MSDKKAAIITGSFVAVVAIAAGTVAVINLNNIKENSKSEVSSSENSIINGVEETPQNNTSPNTNASTDSVNTTETKISSEEALKIALDVAGLEESEVERIRNNLEFDDGIQKYDIEFYSDEGLTKHDYEVNATTGELIEISKEALMTPYED